MHSNLAAHNVLMDDDGNLKVSDIGFALIGEDILSLPTSKASIRWRAPEVLGSKVWRYSSSNNQSTISTFRDFRVNQMCGVLGLYSGRFFRMDVCHTLEK